MLTPFCTPLRSSYRHPATSLQPTPPVGEWWVEEHAERRHCFGRDALFCAFIGWAVVVLTSTRRERLGQRFGFRARRWRSF